MINSTLDISDQEENFVLVPFSFIVSVLNDISVGDPDLMLEYLLEHKPGKISFAEGCHSYFLPVRPVDFAIIIGSTIHLKEKVVLNYEPRQKMEKLVGIIYTDALRDELPDDTVKELDDLPAFSIESFASNMGTVHGSCIYLDPTIFAHVSDGEPEDEDNPRSPKERLADSIYNAAVDVLGEWKPWLIKEH